LCATVPETANAFFLLLLSAHGLPSVSLHLYGAGDRPVRNLRFLFDLHT
jgi:hypothetical protein